jgi:hypothetical protein
LLRKRHSLDKLPALSSYCGDGSRPSHNGGFEPPSQWAGVAHAHKALVGLKNQVGMGSPSQSHSGIFSMGEEENICLIRFLIQSQLDITGYTPINILLMGNNLAGQFSVLANYQTVSAILFSLGK